MDIQSLWDIYFPNEKEPSTYLDKLILIRERNWNLMSEEQNLVIPYSTSNTSLNLITKLVNDPSCQNICGKYLEVWDSFKKNDFKLIINTLKWMRDTEKSTENIHKAADTEYIKLIRRTTGVKLPRKYTLSYIAKKNQTSSSEKLRIIAKYLNSRVTPPQVNIPTLLRQTLENIAINLSEKGTYTTELNELLPILRQSNLYTLGSIINNRNEIKRLLTLSGNHINIQIHPIDPMELSMLLN